MSIASEISRLQTAKANLKSSIEAKGVTVSSSETLDGYYALVDQISGSTPSQRSITISDTSLTTSTNIDTYFSAILDDWNTKDYVLFLRNAPTALNEITNVYSGHMSSTYGFTRVWRASTGLAAFNVTDYINRNVAVVSGHVYDIYEINMNQSS